MKQHPMYNPAFIKRMADRYSITPQSLCNSEIVHEWYRVASGNDAPYPMKFTEDVAGYLGHDSMFFQNLEKVAEFTGDDDLLYLAKWEYGEISAFLSDTDYL